MSGLQCHRILRALVVSVAGCVQGFGVQFHNVWHQFYSTEYWTCSVIALSGHLLSELVVGCVQWFGVRFPTVCHQSQGTEYRTCIVTGLPGFLLLDNVVGCGQGFGFGFGIYLTALNIGPAVA